MKFFKRKKKVLEKKEVQKYIMNFNLNSIIKWELLNNKSFNKIDLSSEDDLISLIYCILICSNDIKYTFEVFKMVFKDKPLLITPLIVQFKKEYEFIDQFKIKSDETVEEKSDEKSENKETDVFIRELAAILIINGRMNSDFVLNKMNINDILLYVTQINSKEHSNIELDRLWTYFNILPHIDSKSLDNPKKLIEFDWEKSDNKEEYININIEEKFKQGEEIYKKINNIE